MGTYCTTTALDTAMIGVTFDTATTALADQCITWSENELNKHLARRYDVSSFLTISSSVPPIVTSWCEQLSIGYLYDNMSRGSKESSTRADRYIKRVMDNLKLVENYELDIVDNSNSVIEDRSDRLLVQSNTDGYTETFDEGDPLNWRVDKDKISDINDAKD